MRKITIYIIITLLIGACSLNDEKPKVKNDAKTGVIHATDLFSPSIDDDDHFDLACQYALAVNNSIELKGLLLDRSNNRDPDVQAVAQLNYLTGLTIPFSVGIPERLKNSNNFEQFHQDQSVKMILDILESSSEPVVIHITGTCRDVTVAG